MKIAFGIMGTIGDITTEYKPPRRGRFTLNYIEAHEDPEDGALLMKLRGPEPKRRIRAHSGKPS